MSIPVERDRIGPDGLLADAGARAAIAATLGTLAAAATGVDA